MNFGTILPNPVTERACDKAMAAKRSKNLANARMELKNLDERVVGGEVRFYSSETIYASVDRSGNYRWFEVRAGGDYAMKINTLPLEGKMCVKCAKPAAYCYC